MVLEHRAADAQYGSHHENQGTAIRQGIYLTACSHVISQDPDWGSEIRNEDARRTHSGDGGWAEAVIVSKLLTSFRFSRRTANFYVMLATVWYSSTGR